MARFVRKRANVEHSLSFSLRLTKNFLISTILPVLLALIGLYFLFSNQRINEIVHVTDSHLASIQRSLSAYLKELKQITLMPYYDENFAIYLSSSNTEKELSFPQRIALKNSLNNTIQFIRYTRSDLHSVIIVNGNRCLYSSTELQDTVTIPGYDYRQESWYQMALDADGRTVFISPHIPQYYDNTADAESVFSMVSSLVNLRTREPYAVIKVDAKNTVFQEMFEGVSFYIESPLILRDNNGEVIYQQGEVDPAMLTLPVDEARESDEITINGKRYLHRFAVDPDFGWSVHTFLNRTELINQQLWFLRSGLLIYFSSLIFMLISFYFFSQKMIRSIQHMREVLHQLENGEFSARYQSLGNDELSSIGTSINEMADRIETLIQSEYLAQISQKEAELRALRSQIQPHFFFNTINNLIALNQMQETEKLEDSLFALSRLMRYVLAKEDNTTISAEIRFLNDYISLQTLRFGNKLQYSCTVDPEIADVQIPRLCLQPYVENAIIHGVEPCERDCHVRLSVKLENGTIVILIEDDGVGFASDYEPGIGTRNSEERLQRSLPGSTVEMRHNMPEGCIIEIRIPEVCK